MTLQPGIKRFLGNHPGKLDEKNRLTIPAQWRFEATAGAEYMAFFNPAVGEIYILPPAMVDQITEAAAKLSLSDPDIDAALNVIGENSDYVSCDKAGRITLKDSMLKQAGIEKEVIFRGRVSAFRICAPKQNAAPATPDELRNAFRKIGL